MKILLTFIGAILLPAGAVFIGQGSGYFPYPASSFMVREFTWVYYGAGIATVGIILVVIARR
jgi:hypothetical protein